MIKGFLLLFRYSPKDRADMGRYASVNGLAAAAAHFSPKFRTKVSKSTLQSIRKDYQASVKEK